MIGRHSHHNRIKMDVVTGLQTFDPQSVLGFRSDILHYLLRLRAVLQSRHFTGLRDRTATMLACHTDVHILPMYIYLYFSREFECNFLLSIRVTQGLPKIKINKECV